MPRSLQSSRREKVSAPIYQRGPGLANAQEVVGGGQGVGEAGADRLQVERDDGGRTELGLHRGCGGGEGVIWGRGRHQDQVQIRWPDPGPGQGLAGGCDREIGGQLAIGREVPLPDPRALPDPFVRGVQRA